ncbi:unnamed protein product [Closterium sp. Naga37s-1]|nr:unnamed protein product [Closterium sp. Naga37s-1]
MDVHLMQSDLARHPLPTVEWLMVRAQWCPCTYSNGELMEEGVGRLEQWVHDVEVQLRDAMGGSKEPLKRELRHIRQAIYFLVSHLLPSEPSTSSPVRPSTNPSPTLPSLFPHQALPFPCHMHHLPFPCHMHHLPFPTTAAPSSAAPSSAAPSSPAPSSPAPSSTLDHKPRRSLEEIEELCPDLTLNQLVHMCIWYEDDAYGTKGVDPSVTERMWALMVDDCPMLLRVGGHAWACRGSTYAQQHAQLSPLIPPSVIRPALIPPCGNPFPPLHPSSIPFTVDDIALAIPTMHIDDLEPPPELQQDPAFHFLLPYRAAAPHTAPPLPSTPSMPALETSSDRSIHLPVRSASAAGDYSTPVTTPRAATPTPAPEASSFSAWDLLRGGAWRRAAQQE